jgi:UrcA family protein
MKQTLKIIAVSALATAALLKGVPVLAEPAQGQNVTIVSTADLDLSTTAGRAALDHRLVTAAKEVCGYASDVDLVGKNQVRACRIKVLAEARANGETLLASKNSSNTILIAASR